MESIGPQRQCIFALGLALVALSAPAPLVAEPGTSPDTSTVAAAACRETVEQFVRDLDGLMAKNPRSLDRYQALLGWYFAPRVNSSASSNWSIVGCDVEQLIQVTKHSKFLHEIGRPPQYRNFRFEFRGGLTKVYFSVDRNTGNIYGASAWWIKFSS
jgi:hypothetical protein